MKKLLIATSAALLLSSTPSMAFDFEQLGVRVTVVEATYIPDQVTFQINKAVGNCAAGTWLTWRGRGLDTLSQQINVEAVFSLLLAAKITGNTVNVYGDNAGCMIRFIHMQ